MISVPGNLLIAGEYAITEEGGLGFAVAVDTYVVARTSDSASFSVRGITGHASRRAVETENGAGGLIERVVEFACDRIGVEPARLEGSAEIDSAALFDPNGRKLGYGSSAAATIAACGIVLKASGMDSETTNILPLLAVDAHRHAQGGRGSGYDVFASMHGGCGLFVGGARPSWHSVPARWLDRLGISHTERPVATTDAIRAYETWKRKTPDIARDYVSRSNAAVETLANADDLTDALESLRACARLGVELGNAIGIPATLDQHRIDLPLLQRDIVCKALGAGNETVGCFGDKSEFPGEWSVARIDRIGVRWR